MLGRRSGVRGSYQKEEKESGHAGEVKVVNLGEAQILTKRGLVARTS